jgi:hypothetical protein
MGFKADLERFLATLPLNKCDKPLLPCVVKAIRSTFLFLEKFKIPFSTETSQ